MSAQLNDEPSERELTPETGSFLAEEDFLPLSQASTASKKRKRGDESSGPPPDDVEHTMYGDELLDYFVTAGDDPGTSNILPPTPPENFDVNRPIDSHGNNALHWACAMGDVQITKDLLSRGANPAAQNLSSGETPLIRAVLFTNNYDKQTFPKVVQLLASTIPERDNYGATVFHHIAETARSRRKWECARYYCEVLINKMREMGSNFVQALLTSTDTNHDTAALCALRNGCLTLACLLLLFCPEAGDLQNLKGETANEYMKAVTEKQDSLDQPGSSPPRQGESFSRRRIRKQSQRKSVSRAASVMMSRVGSVVEEAGSKLAALYDNEMKERDTNIAEAKQTLTDFEAQRHKIRQESYALMARVADESKLTTLRKEYESCLKEMESLLEQKDHGALQKTVRLQDQQAPPQAFRSANDSTLAQDQMIAAFPWAVELHQQQKKRRQLLADVAKLMGDIGAGEKIGKCRKLVAIATGLKEEDLDAMSQELVESLESTQVPSIIDDPRTPPHLSGLEVV